MVNARRFADATFGGDARPGLARVAGAAGRPPISTCCVALFGGARFTEVERDQLVVLDLRRTACRPDGILLIADVLLDHPADAAAIGGLTMGADPMAFGVAASQRRTRRCAASACGRRPRTMASPAASPAPSSQGIGS